MVRSTNKSALQDFEQMVWIDKLDGLLCGWYEFLWANDWTAIAMNNL
jgi:hypothetical protein